MGKLSKGARFLEPALLLIDDLERPNKIAGLFAKASVYVKILQKIFWGSLAAGQAAQQMA